VSRSYLSQLKKGTFYASLKIIGRLAEALQVETGRIVEAAAPDLTSGRASARPMLPHKRAACVGSLVEPWQSSVTTLYRSVEHSSAHRHIDDVHHVVILEIIRVRRKR
jgi:hypothetical protein